MELLFLIAIPNQGMVFGSSEQTGLP